MLQLTRIDSSVLGFLSLFIPMYVRTNHLSLSLGRAVPLLFICMCTFIANDIDDLERDRTNHPERPLVEGHLNATLAAVSYFVCLGLALFLTRQYVDQRIAFWYYSLMILAISYSYVVEYIPSIKAPYVAVAISLPLVVVAVSYPKERRLWLVAAAGFLFALGRELCMDIVDRPGDLVSLLHRIPPRPLAVAAFSIQAGGLTLLLVQLRGGLDVLVVVLMTLVLVVAGVFWFRRRKQKAAYRLMKLQLLLGMYFLV